ncbi:MAG: hypothetical protein K0U66_04135, partial [Gammaproteobacteria bacterium]|nr:hypothetical protein [Gammaproteobacteria bacterium]
AGRSGQNLTSHQYIEPICMGPQTITPKRVRSATGGLASTVYSGQGALQKSTKSHFPDYHARRQRQNSSGNQPISPSRLGDPARI